MEPIFTNEEIIAVLRNFGMAVESREYIVGMVVRDAVEAKFRTKILEIAIDHPWQVGEEVRKIGEMLLRAREED